MSSSDDEVPSPELGASSSKDRPPVTPIVSESDDDNVVKKKIPKYKRPRVKWDRVLSITKGPDAEMDDDEKKRSDFSCCSGISGVEQALQIIRPQVKSYRFRYVETRKGMASR